MSSVRGLTAVTKPFDQSGESKPPRQRCCDCHKSSNSHGRMRSAHGSLKPLPFGGLICESCMTRRVSPSPSLPLACDGGETDETGDWLAHAITSVLSNELEDALAKSNRRNMASTQNLGVSLFKIKGNCF